MNSAIQALKASAPTSSSSKTEWDPLPLLEKVALYLDTNASRLLVFGSVSRGQASPRDLDVVFVAGRDEWAALSQGPHLNRLLSIARAHYGRIDVFVLVGTTLYVCDDTRSGFVRAKNARQLRTAIQADGVPLLDLLARMSAGLPPRRATTLDEGAVAAVCGQFHLPKLAVIDLLTEPVEVLRDRDRYFAMTNAMDPADFPRHQPGAAKIGSYMSYVSESYVDYLDEFDSAALGLCEAEDRIKQHATYARYIEMRKQGYEPPYVQVAENEKGQLVCSNRRRTLVAQELGLPLKGWRSPHNPHTDLPLKYGDVLKAYARALETQKNECCATLCS